MANTMDLGVNEPERRRFPGLRVRGVAIAVVAPAAAGVASIPLARNGPAAAIALFLLAIVIATVAGGLWAGLLAAVLSSLGLVFLSEAQGLALQLEGTEEAVTAVVFLTVALVVGILVGGAAEERARASRREREARLLGHLSSRFVSGEVPDRVLDDFVRVLLEPFGLVSAEVHVELDGTQLRARAVRSELTPGGPDSVVPLVVGPVSFGTLRVERPAGRRPLGPHEQLLLEAASKQAAAALDRARLDARARLAQLDAETNQLRAAMFSSVTHDFRTPLASIKAGVTSLLDPSVEHDPTQERELLTTILEETDRLNRLVGNILDLARIRAGALIPARNEAGLDEIAEVVVARLVPRLHDVRIVLDIDDDVPPVAVDEMQLDQVMTNLLENAARHSPPGGEVRLSVSPSNDHVVVRVTDQGPGVPAGDRERIFEAFYRGASIPDSPGTGLGLAIANAIVTAHGGRIWVEDAVGERRDLRVRDPRVRAGPRGRPRPRRSPGRSGGAHMTLVLVVDDEPQIRRALRTSLEAHGYEVATVGTGEEGVVGAAEQAPDLVLLDLGLPDIDGTEVIRRVRGFSDVPVIVLSVRESQTDKVAALDAGADDYVTKPFGMEELLARARAAMRRKQSDEPSAPVLRFGRLEVDLPRRLVTLDGEQVRLTPTEYGLLEALVTNPGKLLTHQWLLRKVWGQGYGTETTYLRTYVRALRNKLGDDAQAPALIVTEPGVGYRWVAEVAG